jgi:hypothetical protein
VVLIRVVLNFLEQLLTLRTCAILLKQELILRSLKQYSNHVQTDQSLRDQLPKGSAPHCDASATTDVSCVTFSLSHLNGD